MNVSLVEIVKDAVCECGVCVCVQVVNGDKNSVVLRYLNSLTEYQITVFAIYSNAASEALRGSETTCECA